MKKILFIIASIATLLTVSCSKQEAPFVENLDPANRTFMVDVQQTKTTIDGLAVKWAAGDKIRVYGYTKVGEDPASIGEAEFHIKSGVGSSSAVFEIEDGQSLGEFNTYYAVYPSTIQFKTESLPTNLEVSTSTTLDLDNQVIADGASYDPSFALMTAVYSESKLSFRHGVAYIKLQIPEDGITAAEVSFGANATGKRPIYTASTGEVSSVQGGYNKVKASGNLVKDNWYFLPVPARASNPGDVTVKFYKGAVESSRTTKSLEKKRLETGSVYNLGCPPVSFEPSINALDVDIDKDATGGDIDFTIVNPAGDGVISIAETGGKTNPADFDLNTTLQTDHFEFECAANATSDPRKFYVTLTYTYNSGADEVTKDVVITQAGAVVTLTNVTATTSWASSFTALKDTGEVTESFIYDNLGFVAGGGKFKFGSDSTGDRVQLGGSGSLTKTCIEFLVGGPGTVSVVARSSGDSARTIVICLAGEIKENTSGNAPGKASDPATISVNLSSATSGQKVSIYSAGSAINVYDITWTPAS